MKLYLSDAVVLGAVEVLAAPLDELVLAQQVDQELVGVDVGRGNLKHQGNKKLNT